MFTLQQQTEVLREMKKSHEAELFNNKMKLMKEQVCDEMIMMKEKKSIVIITAGSKGNWAVYWEAGCMF